MDVQKDSVTIAVLPMAAKNPTRLERLPNDSPKARVSRPHRARRETRVCYEASGAGDVLRLRIGDMHGSNTYWRAAIAATIGEKERAVRLLRQSFFEGTSMSGAVHRQQEFLSPRGYPPFDDRMRPR